MSFQFIPYSEEHIPLVKAFNQRLNEHTDEYRFPEHPQSEWLPEIKGRSLYEKMFLVLEDNIMRGGYVLKYQDFLVNGFVKPIVDLRLPISEGIINPQYSMLGLIVLKDAMKREPLMYGLGMGGWNLPIVRLLKATKWFLCEVPFYFQVIHPFRFFRKIKFLRKTASKRLLLDLLAFTGLGAIGSQCLFTILRFSNQDSSVSLKGIQYEVVSEWGDWVDEIWEQGKTNYNFAAVRTRPILEILYPNNNPRFHKLLIKRNGKPLGWAVVIVTSMKNHKQFGDLRVGTFVDCFALPKSEGFVTKSATDYMKKQNADLIVSNQFHQDWTMALQKCGYLRGPSNYLFAASPELTKVLNLTNGFAQRCHMNRGDGDGPIHL